MSSNRCVCSDTLKSLLLTRFTNFSCGDLAGPRAIALYFQVRHIAEIACYSPSSWCVYSDIVIDHQRTTLTIDIKAPVLLKHLADTLVAALPLKTQDANVTMKVLENGWNAISRDADSKMLSTLSTLDTSLTPETMSVLADLVAVKVRHQAKNDLVVAGASIFLGITLIYTGVSMLKEWSSSATLREQRMYLDKMQTALQTLKRATDKSWRSSDKGRSIKANDDEHETTEPFSRLQREHDL